MFIDEIYESDDVDGIINGMEYMQVSHDTGTKNADLIEYIEHNQNIDEQIKETIIKFIINDNYANYIDIYNICMENDIELPPITN